jgi:hypothetical protein
MKATIEFPDWIDENEFEFVGWKYLESGEYGIGSLEAKEWNIQGWQPLVHGGLVSYQWTNKFFCFRKKQKFVWPECFKDGTEISYYESIVLYDDRAWLIKLNNSCIAADYSMVESLNNVLKEEYQIDTSMLDKDKVYVKGEE